MREKQRKSGPSKNNDWLKIIIIAISNKCVLILIKHLIIFLLRYGGEVLKEKGDEQM